jgi:hypothetical protein
MGTTEYSRGRSDDDHEIRMNAVIRLQKPPTFWHLLTIPYEPGNCFLNSHEDDNGGLIPDYYGG